jgi:peptidoglycan-associated lipoprotein
MKKSRILTPMLFLITLGVAGCGGEEAVKPEPAAPAARPSPAPERPVQAQAVETKLPAQRRAYFAFDSNTIDAENRAIIEANAAYLSANPQVKVTLEGHCDERGTREYNLALGERRAQAVERMMRVLGIAGNRISTVSYGEEKPIAMGHDESAWRQNRRVEIVYK